MYETNPFKVFSPLGAKYLILGSFAAKDGRKGHAYDWYYSNGRNYFWPILRQIYSLELDTKSKQQALFRELHIAIADVILKCKRTKKSSLDVNLKECKYNIAAISKVFETRRLTKVFFTSRFVEKIFRRRFAQLLDGYPEIEFVTLPSPSPRYAQLTVAQKTAIYRRLLPKR